MKIIIDTDPGVDDAMAIFYAASRPDLQILGLTTVFGNVHVDVATRNALHLVELLGRDIPVAQGSGRALIERSYSPPAFVHGEHGFGSLGAPSPQGRAIDTPAPEFLIEMARKHRGELMLFPVGPLTNIAEAIRLDPDFARNLAGMVIMGGAVRARGNVNAHAEANIHNDAEAADIVFASDADITLIGLDVTDRILVTKQDFAEAAKQAPRLGGFLAQAADFYIDFYGTRGMPGCSLHDPAAIIAALHPEMFTFAEGELSVSTAGETLGKTELVEGAGRGRSRAAIGTDPRAVSAEFLRGIASLD